MERKIRFSIVLILFFAFVTPSVMAQSSPCSERENIVVTLATGETLPVGTYQATINVDGAQETAVVNVNCIPDTSAAANPPPVAGEGEQPINTAGEQDVNEISGEGETAVSPPAAFPEPPTATAESSGLITIVAAALIPIVLIGLGAFIYLKVIKPRNQLAPYNEALEHLQKKDFQAALPILTSIESKLPDKQRQEARFYIAFSNFQLKNYSEAQHQLKTLYRESPSNVSVTYLLAYAHVHGKRYDEAEPILEKMESNKTLKMHHARKLLGIVKFHRGLIALQEGRLDAASTLFEKVQALGDYADQIPADLRNRHVILGTKALFEKDPSEARKQFQSLEKAKSEIPTEQRHILMATAKLGLALADWIEESSESYQTIERLLVEAAKLLAPKDPVIRKWSYDADAKDIGSKLEALDNQAPQTPEDEDINRCLRDLHFLRGMVILRAWSQMEGEKAHEEIGENMQNALARFACSLAYDDDFSDIMLVVGLLQYYLHKPGSAERKEGLDNLEEAQKRGMRDPDAMEIINNRERIERANADAVDKYLQVLDKYLTDDTVRKDVRISLMEKLSRYRKIQSWEKRPNLTQARTVEPTVAEMRDRSEILRARITQILETQRDSKQLEDVVELSQGLEKEGQQLYEQAQKVSKNEAALLAMMGNQLLQDE